MIEYCNCCLNHLPNTGILEKYSLFESIYSLNNTYPALYLYLRYILFVSSFLFIFSLLYSLPGYYINKISMHQLSDYCKSLNYQSFFFSKTQFNKCNEYLEFQYNEFDFISTIFFNYFQDKICSDTIYDGVFSSKFFLGDKINHDICSKPDKNLNLNLTFNSSISLFSSSISSQNFSTLFYSLYSFFVKFVKGVGFNNFTLISSLTGLIYYFWFLVKIDQTIKEIDYDNITPSDYAVLVSNVDIDGLYKNNNSVSELKNLFFDEKQLDTKNEKEYTNINDNCKDTNNINNTCNTNTEKFNSQKDFNRSKTPEKTKYKEALIKDNVKETDKLETTSHNNSLTNSNTKTIASLNNSNSNNLSKSKKNYLNKLNYRKK